MRNILIAVGVIVVLLIAAGFFFNSFTKSDENGNNI